MTGRDKNRSGFTMVEILVAAGIIALLIAVLFPALIRVGRVARKTESMSRLRQINIWMASYSNENNDYILPSQFDYSDDAVFLYPGKVRTIPDTAVGKTLSLGDENEGTWADIIWTENEIGKGFSNVKTAEEALGHSWEYDSPSTDLYEFLDNDLDNPLRSAAANSRWVNSGDGVMLPYGDGANEMNFPGYFAANDFFNARPDVSGSGPIGNWYTNGQLKVPDRSMYLVDSYAGEIIEPQLDPYLNPWYSGGEGAQTFDHDDPGEVDFRYNGTCLMLFLDGHIENVGPWPDLESLQDVQEVNVTNPLTSTPTSP